jgi:hypothetical protein
LLDALAFDPAKDKVWITGDLVNRGEDSLAVLRWGMQHDHCVVAVLGNHDLHLLAVAQGFVPPHRKDTLDMILGAPDRDELLDLAAPPAHAASGRPLDDGPRRPAARVERRSGAIARGANWKPPCAAPKWRQFLKHMYGNEPRRWNPNLTGQDRLRYIANVLTRSRFLYPDGSLEFQHKLGLDTAPPELTPGSISRSPRQGRSHPVRTLVHPGPGVAGGRHRPGYRLPLGWRADRLQAGGRAVFPGALPGAASTPLEAGPNSLRIAASAAPANSLRRNPLLGMGGRKLISARTD